MHGLAEIKSMNADLTERVTQRREDIAKVREYLSTQALVWPDKQTAADTRDAFNRLFPE